MGKPRAKIKTQSGAKKRFKFTKSGKLKRSKAFGRHILTKKSSKRMRRLKKSDTVNASDMKRVSRLLPYG